MESVKVIVTTEIELRAIVAGEVQRCLSAFKLPEAPQPTAKQGNYTSKQLQELFGVTPQTVWAWERKGLLKPVIVQRKKTYLNDDIQKLIHQKQLNKRA